MKNYGSRTLIGNWWEERQNIEAYVGREVPLAEQTVDLHVSAKRKNPDLVYTDNTPVRSTYSIDTDPANIEQQKRLQKKVEALQRRKIMVGSLPNTKAPKETMTLSQLSTQFYNPEKTRYKTVYQKSYNHPEFETIRAMRAASPTPHESFVDARKSTLDLSWND